MQTIGWVVARFVAWAWALVAGIGGGIKVAAIEDPFGNRLGIIENPNFRASEVR